ncbi:TetR/AcrR family transcriptional regulator [Cryptosporangium aurantiacum]|uniref:Transcriptional regulator, TetR family n=1 Tax=Cryptosporangium aurantiacum TaxID=134849 RepID=A0A1M7TYN5_9ACTN|nr:TetR/AcrR family transcriptional regulator [Cryptosporangium aurantiacum]SHN75797.1 transcriptional regulator, TetR family [Cryptosporangium aurantiacum]
MTAETEGGAGGVPLDGLPPWQLARRERIIDAALAVLRQQEYERIQIRDVAEAADVARATLYRYFASKDHLYACVLQKWSALDRPDPALRQATAEDRVRTWIHRLIRAFEREPSFFRASLALQHSADPEAKRILGEMAVGSVARLTQHLAVLGPDRAADAADILFSIVNWGSMRAIFHGGEMTKVHRLADRFIDSLAPELR